MVRRAGYGLREPAGFRVARGKRARAAVLSVSREEAQPTSLLRACSAPHPSAQAEHAQPRAQESGSDASRVGASRSTPGDSNGEAIKVHHMAEQTLTALTAQILLSSDDRRSYFAQNGGADLVLGPLRTHPSCAPIQCTRTLDEDDHRTYGLHVLSFCCHSQRFRIERRTSNITADYTHKSNLPIATFHA